MNEFTFMLFVAVIALLIICIASNVSELLKTEKSEIESESYDEWTVKVNYKSVEEARNILFNTYTEIVRKEG